MAPTFWLRKPFPGKSHAKSRRPGNSGNCTGNSPVDILREISRGIPRELGCAPRKFPGRFHGCASEIPGDSAWNSTGSHFAGNFPGNPRGLHFPRNARPWEFAWKYHRLPQRPSPPGKAYSESREVPREAHYQRHLQNIAISEIVPG